MNLLNNLQAIFLLLVCSTCIQAQSGFTTVINLPEDPATPNPIGFSGNSIGDFIEISSNTQLNVSDGGSVGDFFNAGEPLSPLNPPNSFSTNVEVNVSGGTVGLLPSANRGSTVNISGGSVGSNLEAQAGSTVNISGGTVVFFIANSDSTVNISGGTVGGFAADPGSTVNISEGAFGGFEAGGFVLPPMQSQSASIVNISGGTFDGFIRTNSFGDTIMNVSGGTFTDTLLLNGGVVNVSDGNFSDAFFVAGGESTVSISGGTFANRFQVDTSNPVNISGGTLDAIFSVGFTSTVNLLGTAFFLNGTPLENLVLDQATTIFDRGEDIVLSGVLADGTMFDFELNEEFVTNSAGDLTQDVFDPGSTLTVTLVTAVPEPSSGLTLATISTLLLTQRRRRFARG